MFDVHLQQTGEELRWFQQYGYLVKELVHAITTLLPPAKAGKDQLAVDNSALYHQLRMALAAKDFVRPDGEKWPVADLTTAKNTMQATAQLLPFVCLRVMMMDAVLERLT